MIESIFSEKINSWFWLSIISVAGFAFKDSIKNFFLGCQFLFGNDFNVDDIVYINGEKKARIVRQGIWKTTFYIINDDKSVRKFITPNKLLWYLYIEKELKQKELINYTTDNESVGEKANETKFTQEKIDRSEKNRY
jgi:small-conductance mechanosensitive channel